MRMTRIRSSFDTVTFRKKFNGLRELRIPGIFSLTIFPVTSSHRRCNADPGGHMGQTARTDREIDADFATVTTSLPSIESLLIGRSRKMAEVRRLIARVARSQASVLVTGPTGSGKEVVARCLHETSSRRGACFVAVTCGAFPTLLLASDLFGHEKGERTSG